MNTSTMTPDVLDYIERSVLCWLATVDADGLPNVSPKEIFCADGTHSLLVAHIASPGSARNVRANPAVCVGFVDVFAQRGYKLHGMAELIEPQDPRFAVLAAPLAHMAGERFPIRGVFAVRITRIEPILAPSYRMIPGTTEASQVAAALRAYGVRRPA
ncbi:MAG TPA: pyridoxamine 5'-phosphate oxidase family protein [Burkholderiaceae bacterium]|nr:pyridoxamine 5'-phosphate oxidase family protein [Burkholderiaceae bacterium]